ncbi:hypothetical protein F511_17490 [Dorcoceras hygrometricum]|uniref:Uncharacterized protein n=1 Tax=Dorcoceras hygrometricum TaxID=472368 RepID=A0A2Z7AIN1_9LAMI|nr:hypothetical protein F511_17490 [Dorcoceras hygrometricum]
MLSNQTRYTPTASKVDNDKLILQLLFIVLSRCSNIVVLQQTQESAVVRGFLLIPWCGRKLLGLGEPRLLNLGAGGYAIYRRRCTTHQAIAKGESNQGARAQLRSPGRGLETFSGITPRDVPEDLRHGEELGGRGSNLSSGYFPRTPTRHASLRPDATPGFYKKSSGTSRGRFQDLVSSRLRKERSGRRSEDHVAPGRSPDASGPTC